MFTLIDTSLWSDFTRARSPQFLKGFIAPYILSRAAHIAEAVRFELLRHATAEEARQLTAQLDTLPVLATPADIWARAALLGQACRRRNVTAGSIDLLVAATAIHHSAELVTFDADFSAIATASALRVKLLFRPLLPP